VSTDWWSWVDRWDDQQERYLPHREERVGLMLDVIERTQGDGAVCVLDLCCGNGSITRRLLARFPDATVVAVDMDPVNLELGRRTLGGRVRWLDVDLRREGWANEFPRGTFDAVVTATAIHWFRHEEIVRLYGHLAALLRPGGVFLNADHLPVTSEPVGAISRDLLDRWQRARLAGAESFSDFRESTADDPALGALTREAERRFADKPPGEELPLEWHRDALVQAGFHAVDEIWRYHTDAVLLAVR